MKKTHFLASMLALALSCRFCVDGEDGTGGATAAGPFSDATAALEPSPAPQVAPPTQADPVTETPVPEKLPVDVHPAHRVLDEMETELNALGSFAMARLQAFIDGVRSLL